MEQLDKGLLKPGKEKEAITLSELTPGQAGEIAFVHTNEPEQLQKLTALGILPGVPISLQQNFPAYVFRIHRTQFAVDKEIAGSIFVSLISQ